MLSSRKLVFGRVFRTVSGTKFKSNGSNKCIPGMTVGAFLAASFLSYDHQVKASAVPIATHYDFVIIGNGTAAFTALEVVRETQPHSKVLLISEDQAVVRQDVFQEGTLNVILQDVYNEWRRHMGCKLNPDELMDGKANNIRSWSTRGTVQYSKVDNERTAGMLSVLLEDMDTIQLDPVEKSISFADGRKVTYSKCLLSPSGKPREMYVLKSTLRYSMQEKLNTLRDSQEFENLERICMEGGRRILVVGGGFLGSSLSSALLQLNNSLEHKNTIMQTFVESVSLQNYLPGYLTAHMADKLEDKGLVMYPDCLVTSLSRQEADGDPSHAGALQVKLMQSGEHELVDVDYVVLASTNVQPDVRVAVRAGLEIDSKNGGVLVNSSLEAYDGLFVAGNSASYYDQALGRKRVDFYDNAVNSGLCAGQNMACDDGRLMRYMHQPMFRCALPGTGVLLEGIGIIDSNLATVGVWLSKRDEVSRKPLSETSFERGVIYYLRNNIVVGILCYNASECLEVARDIMSERLSFEEASKRIMLAPEPWTRIYRTK